MATNEQAVRTIPKRTHSYNNAPLDSNNGRRNSNPVTPNDIHITDTGIVREKQGKVYFELNKGKEADALYFEVLVRDEFNNLVALVRNSNEGDISTGSYENNQGVKNRPVPRTKTVDGRTSRNIDSNGQPTL